MSSGIVMIRSTSTPSVRSSRHRYGEFVSTTFPERISFPITRIPAVGISRLYGPLLRAVERGPTLAAMDVQVHFPKQGASVRVPSGTLLIDAVRGANLPIASACRGVGL